MGVLEVSDVIRVCAQFIFQSADSLNNGQVFQISPSALSAGVYIIGLYNMVRTRP